MTKEQIEEVAAKVDARYEKWFTCGHMPDQDDRCDILIGIIYKITASIAEHEPAVRTLKRRHPMPMFNKFPPARLRSWFTQW